MHAPLIIRLATLLSLATAIPFQVDIHITSPTTSLNTVRLSNQIRASVLASTARCGNAAGVCCASRIGRIHAIHGHGTILLQSVYLFEISLVSSSCAYAKRGRMRRVSPRRSSGFKTSEVIGLDVREIRWNSWRPVRFVSDCNKPWIKYSRLRNEYEWIDPAKVSQ